MKWHIAEEYAHITSQEEIWEAFSDHQFNALIESMPACIEAVIKAKGGVTKY
jgi:hypothetical protein